MSSLAPRLERKGTWMSSLAPLLERKATWISSHEQAEARATRSILWTVVGLNGGRRRMSWDDLARQTSAGHFGVSSAQNPLMQMFVGSQQSAAVVHFSCSFEHIPSGGAFEQISSGIPPGFGEQKPLQH